MLFVVHVFVYIFDHFLDSAGIFEHIFTIYMCPSLSVLFLAYDFQFNPHQ